MNNPLSLQWSTVTAALGTLQPASGGFTMARRGIVRLDNGTAIFVKIGNDADTKRWTTKEITVYEFLARQGVAFAPRLLATSDDNTAFAIDALEAQSGWDWSDTWTEARLTHTLQGMDAIAAIKPTGKDAELFTTSFVDESADGWRQLTAQPELQTILRNKLIKSGHAHLSDELDFQKATERSRSFVFQRDVLVHNDVRADNCAWNSVTQTVQFVDWTWAQFGDRRIDVGSFLVHVQKTGFDVLAQHVHQLDVEALHWLAGFWFASATRPILEGGPERSALRDHQLQSGVTALKLAQHLTIE